MFTDVPQKVFLILDNLKVHHGKLAAAWLDKHKEQIELFFLPPYLRELNSDRYLNHALKLAVHSGLKPRVKSKLRAKTNSLCAAYNITLMEQ